MGEIMLTNMTTEERERLAHAEGFTEAAALLARVADLEHALQRMVTEFKHYVKGNQLDEEIQALELAVKTLDER